MSEYDHYLKTHPQYFKAVIEGRKRFEIREAKDRYFKVGDWVQLEEFVSAPDGGEYTGNAEVVVISYVTTYEQLKGNVVFGFELAPV